MVKHNQLEREKRNRAFLQEAQKEQPMCKCNSDTGTHSLSTRKVCSQVRLEGIKAKPDKLETPVALLCPLIKN